MASGNVDETVKTDTTDKAENEVKTGKIRKHPLLGHPFLGAILILIHGVLFYGILAGFGRDDIEFGLLCVVASVLLLLIHKFWFRSEFKGAISFEFIKNHRILIGCGIFLLFDLCTTIPSYIEHGFTGLTVWAIVTSLGAGTVEEVVFRVLPVSIMMRSPKFKNNAVPVLIFTSVIFGGVHVLNVSHGQSLSMSVFQAFSSCSSGIFYGALYLCSGSIVPSMIVHFLHDVLGGMVVSYEDIMAGSLNFQDAVVESIMLVTKILIGVWVFWGQKDKIREIWDRIWNRSV